MPENNTVLSCEGLSFRYEADRPYVFEGLSLSVKRGEAVLLMGASGSGKSTLAYCLSGLYPEYAGSMEGKVYVDGCDISGIGTSKRAGLVSILFQNPDSQFCMDKVENEVLFALENINYKGDLRARAEELLKTVDLADEKTKAVSRLSGGMKQKLALCTALATEAEVLILDEPFANLDTASCAALADILAEMKCRGTTLLVVDHRADWWIPLLDRVVFMEPEGSLDDTSIPPEKFLERKEEFAKRGLFLGAGWLSGRKAPEVPADAGVMVKAENLGLFHGKKPYLKGLSFEIRKGSITSVIGACGSGKTTLLTAIAGIGRHSGLLETGGEAGLVFQNPRFQFLKTTVEEEVLFSLEAAQAADGSGREPADGGAAGGSGKPGTGDGDDIKTRADGLLKEFGLAELKDHSPYAISQGQQRRLALLAMMAADRPLMLLDEPTYAQDERSTRFILDLLMKKVSEGMTVIMATHDIELANAVSNQILLLEDGCIKELSHEEAEAYFSRAKRQGKGGGR